MLPYVFEWVPGIIYTYVFEGGRKDEAEAEMGGWVGVGSGDIVQEREGRLNRESTLESGRGLKGLWKECVGVKTGERVILESQLEEEQARQNVTQLYITVLRDGR